MTKVAKKGGAFEAPLFFVWKKIYFARLAAISNALRA
jgi:hypothetical protein